MTNIVGILIHDNKGDWMSTFETPCLTNSFIVLVRRTVVSETTSSPETRWRGFIVSRDREGGVTSRKVTFLNYYRK